MTTLLANHIFWTKALGKLESAGQQQIQLKSLAASAAKKEVIASGRAPNYTAIARQIASFVADEAVKDVNLSDAKVSNIGGIEFSMQLLFDESKFLRKK